MTPLIQIRLGCPIYCMQCRGLGFDICSLWRLLSKCSGFGNCVFLAPFKSRRQAKSDYKCVFRAKHKVQKSLAEALNRPGSISQKEKDKAVSFNLTLTNSMNNRYHNLHNIQTVGYKEAKVLSSYATYTLLHDGRKIAK